MGYYRAGFEVVGVDKEPQPHYPFPYIQMDALEAMDRLLRGEGLTFSNGETLYLEDFDAYHASPPCQRFSNITKMHGTELTESFPDLIPATRELLAAARKPYIIENVPGAKKELNNPFKLCGTMFGLKSGQYALRRHRYFECSFDIYFAPATCHHIGLPLSVYGHPGGSSCREHQKMGNSNDWRVGMDIDWMTTDELAQAIPLAYTEYIGLHLIKALY